MKYTLTGNTPAAFLRSTLKRAAASDRTPADTARACAELALRARALPDSAIDLDTAEIQACLYALEQPRRHDLSRYIGISEMRDQMVTDLAAAAHHQPSPETVAVPPPGR